MIRNKQFEREITTIHTRIDAKQNAIRELEYELKLLENEAERIANRHEECKITPFIERSIEWLKKRDNYNKQESDKDEFAFDVLKESLCEISGQVIKDITAIAICGLDGHAWSIRFTINSDPANIYQLTVPNYKDISFNCLQDTSWGQFVLHTTNKGSMTWKWCWAGYDSHCLHEYFDSQNDKED